MSRIKAILAGLLAIALVGSHIGVFWLGGEHTRRVVAEKGQERAQNAVQAVLEAQQKAIDADLRLQKILAQPKSLPKIAQVISENPPTCELPGPVADGLRSEIDRRNKQISSSQHAGGVP